MATVKLPTFIGPAYQLRNPVASPEELINWFVESVETPGASSPTVYSPAPGFESRITVPETPIRALFQLPASSASSERGFFVAGVAFYEAFADFSTELRREKVSGLRPLKPFR